MKRVRVSVILSVLLTFCGIADDVSACSCREDVSHQESFEAAGAVFLGEAIAKRGVGVNAHGFVAAHVVTFRVSRSWKGVASEEVEVETPNTFCSISFTVGEEYVVYTEGDGNAGTTSWLGGIFGGTTGGTAGGSRLSTHFCTPTHDTTFHGPEALDELARPIYVNPAYRFPLLSEELLTSCLRGDAPRVRELVRAGHDVNGKERIAGTTALIAATSGGHAETVRVLLEAGARVDEVKLDRTALMEAARGGHVETARVLLAAGADPNLHTEHGSPLLAAVANEKLVVAALLLLSGARADGEALVAAAGRGPVEMVVLLLRAGAPVHRPSRSGETALQAAARGGHPDIEHVLLAAGKR